MHETQIEKLRWLFRDLGIDAEFTRSVTLTDDEGLSVTDDVAGIFMDDLDANRFIEALSIAASVAA